MSIEELFKKRKQIKLYDVNNTPDKALIESLIDKTFDLVPSKQSLIPYKIYILGPDCFKLKEIFSTWVLLSLKLVFINQVYELVTDLLIKVSVFDIKIALKIFFFFSLPKQPNKHL